MLDLLRSRFPRLNLVEVREERSSPLVALELVLHVEVRVRRRPLGPVATRTRSIERESRVIDTFCATTPR
jgi:hypothetical protein